MSRAKWKGNFIDLNLFKNKSIKIKSYNRSSVIPEILIGKIILVYNGKIHKNIKINREKIGYKLGEFSFTRVVKEKKKKIFKKKK